MSVCLLQMPYAALERPSIALGLLKAGLGNVGVPVTVFYANWWWAERLGLSAYQALSESPAASLLGEWSFAEAALGYSGDDDFLEQVLTREVPEGQREVLRRAMPIARVEASAFLDEAAERALQANPKLVGCSSTFQQNCASLGVLKRIKEVAPETLTVMGGANCDGPMARQLLKSFPWLDLAFSGEADLSFPEFCLQFLRTGLPPADRLPVGVVHRDSPGSTTLRSTLEQMDDAPTPDYEDYFQTRGKSKLRRRVYPGLAVETSRGCWWGQKHHCTFCGLNGGGMMYRSKSPDRVIQEFEHLSSTYGLQQFGVVDNILDMKHIRTVLPNLAQHDYKIFYETKANLKRSQLETLRQAGVLWIQPGIESLHDEVLELMDKGNTAAMNLELLRNCKELGIRVDWSILCGFPGERDEYYQEMADWLPAVIHLEPPIGLFQIRYDRFSPYHTNPEAYGVKLKPYWTYQHCYPLQDEELRELAYFFEDEGPGPRGRYEPQKEALLRPGTAALRRRVVEWQQKGPDVRLRFEDHGDKIRVFDFRPMASASQYDLKGLPASICRACSSATGFGSLQRDLAKLEGASADPERLEEALSRLAVLGLVIQVGGRYVNVMLSQTARPPLMNFPGGSVMTHQEAPRPTTRRVKRRTRDLSGVLNRRLK
jgi:ribosomal peptide maturation radical SAM protein 1